MRKTLVLLALMLSASVVMAQEITGKIIAVETENTQILLRTSKNGSLEMLRYGVKLDKAPFELSQKKAAPAFPAAGGLTVDDAAISVTYPDGRLNTERSFWWGDGRSFKGEYLEQEGMDLEMCKMFDSAVFYIEAL